MLIVEGPDGAGKTTLALRLSEDLQWPVATRVVGADTQIVGGRTELKSWVEENLAQGFQQTIFDRHRLISEPIYGPLFRGELQDGFDDDLWFAGAWNLLLAIRPVVVFCLPPLDQVMRNLRDDEENVVVRDKAPIVYWQYWTLYCRMGVRAMRYDYTNFRNTYSAILAWAQTEEENHR